MPRAERARRFLVDPDAFTCDPAVMSMSLPARGAYAFLWLNGWRQKLPGTYPADPRVLAHFAMVTVEEWSVLSAEVSAAFHVDMSAKTWTLPVMLSTLDQQDIKRTQWRKQKQRQRMRPADNARTSAPESSVGSGSGSGSGSGTEKPPSVSPATTLALPAIGGKFWTPSEDQVAAMRAAYPAVPLEPAFARMRSWLAANPTNGKTPRGLPRFANRWLAKDQDRAGTNGAHASPAPTTERFRCRERDCHQPFERPVGSHDELCPDCRRRYAT